MFTRNVRSLRKYTRVEGNRCICITSLVESFVQLSGVMHQRFFNVTKCFVILMNSSLLKMCHTLGVIAIKLKYRLKSPTTALLLALKSLNHNLNDLILFQTG